MKGKILLEDSFPFFPVSKYDHYIWKWDLTKRYFGFLSALFIFLTFKTSKLFPTRTFAYLFIFFILLPLIYSYKYFLLLEYFPLLSSIVFTSFFFFYFAIQRIFVVFFFFDLGTLSTYFFFSCSVCVLFSSVEFVFTVFSIKKIYLVFSFFLILLLW